MTRNYLRALALGRAVAINASTYKKLEEAQLAEDQTPQAVMERRQTTDSISFGRMLANGVAGWAATHEAPQQALQQGVNKIVEKEWVTGDNPRQSHALMNGEVVPISEPFSNGAMWPGDDILDADESCGCNCSTQVIITEV